MKFENIVVGRDSIGWHGIGDVKVIESSNISTTTDISTWVDKNGFGTSAGRQYVKKEFTSIIVLLKDVILECKNYTRLAPIAYIGVRGKSIKNRYIAEFKDTPPIGDYQAFFPHDSAIFTFKNGGIINPKDFSLEEVINQFK